MTMYPSELIREFENLISIIHGSSNFHINACTLVCRQYSCLGMHLPYMAATQAFPQGVGAFYPCTQDLYLTYPGHYGNHDLVLLHLGGY